MLRLRKEQLRWFNEEESHFIFALGGDGAPVNKANGLTMLMVSFINRGRHLGSPSENFMRAAGDDGELDEVWLQVMNEAVHQAELMQGKSSEICGLQCWFSPQLVQAHQKWLAHFPGELPN